MIYIILFLALPFIGIWMIQSGTKSMGKSINEIKELQKGKTRSEKATMHGCAILMMIVFFLFVWYFLT